MKYGKPSQHHNPSFPVRRASLPEDSVDSWLMSYADMITLLLSFFIIFVSVSEPKNDRLAAVTEGMASRFGTIELSTPYLGMYRAIQASIEQHDAFREASVEKTERGVEIELSSGSFFQPQTAEIEPKQMETLADITEALKTGEFADYNITVESHTDDVEVSSKMFASNWELSSTRAARMIHILTEKGLDPANMKAVAFAGTQPKVPNLDAQGNPIPENREKNQRIVIKLERKE